MARAQIPCRIEWQPTAREDSRAIVQYIGKDRPSRARSFGHELRDKNSYGSVEFHA
jgi:plasmid stabilization system protein ParE